MEQFLGFIFELILRLENKARKDQLKQKIANIIRISFQETESRFDDFLDAYMLLIGSQIIGLFIVPLNPKEKANFIVNDLIDSFNSFKQSLIELLNLIKAHQNSIRQVLNDDEWLKIEPILYSLKDDSIDWQFLIKHPIFSDFYGIREDNTFIQELASQVTRIPNEMKFLRTDFKEDINNILSSEEFDKLLKKADTVGKKSKKRKSHSER